MAENSPKQATRDLKDFTLGEFLVSPNNLEIIRGKSRQQLEAKAMATLVYLVQHQGRTCSSHEIMSDVWHDTVVSDNTLRRIITQLRKALNDDASSPRFIKTIPRKGYQLIQSASHPSPQNSDKPKRNPIVWLTLPITLVISLFLIFANDSKPIKYTYKSIPVTSEIGQEIMPTMSTDGKLVIYAYRPDDATNFKLFAKQQNKLTHTRLKGVNGPAILPKISPDNDKLVYFDISDGNCKITLGKLNTKELSVSQQSIMSACDTDQPLILSWLNEENIVFLSPSIKTNDSGATSSSTLNSSKTDYTLIEKNIYTGQETTLDLKGLPPTLPIIRAASSPDSQQQAFLIKQGSSYQLWVKSDNAPIQLTSTFNMHIFDMAFCGRANTLFLTNGAQILAPKLQTNSANGHATHYEKLIEVEPNERISYFSCNENSLYYSKRYRISHLVRHLDEENAFERPQRLHQSMSSDMWPMFANTSNDIMFASNRRGSWDLLQSNNESLHAILPFEQKQIFPSIWSPDDSKILLLQPNHFVIQHLHEGHQQQLTSKSDDAYTATWARDGKGIYYTKAKNGDVWYIDVTEKTSKHQLIAEIGAEDIAISANGKQLFYTKKSKSGVWAYQFASKSQNLLIPDAKNTTLMLPFKDGIYINRMNEKPPAVYFYDFQTRKLKRKFPELSYPHGSQMTVSADQSQIIYVEYDRYQADLHRIDFKLR